KLDAEYIAAAKLDSKMTDLMISNGTYITRLFQTGFWYNGEVLECGFPRNDILLQDSPELKAHIRNKLMVKEGTKLLVYAPSFRVDTRVEEYLFDFEAARKHLKNTFGGDWVILLRLHPNVAQLSGDIEYSEY